MIRLHGFFKVLYTCTFIIACGNNFLLCGGGGGKKSLIRIEVPKYPNYLAARGLPYFACTSNTQSA